MPDVTLGGMLLYIIIPSRIIMWIKYNNVSKSVSMCKREMCFKFLKYDFRKIRNQLISLHF